MKSSSELIAKQVFSVNAFYTKKQNKTKELFFKCLNEKRSYEYFEKELSKIWDDVDHKFMDKQLDKLKEVVHSNNVEEALNLGRLDDEFKRTMNWVIDDEYFRLTPESEFQKFEQKFKQNVEKNYKRSSKAIQGLDKETYLSKKIDTYNPSINQVVTYFTQTGKPVRQVQLSSYLSMIHNTNLTRSGWNQTMSDSHLLNQDHFIIPYHSFSCPHCLSFQNRVLTAKEVENIIGVKAEAQTGDILHPNCKCTLSIFWDASQISNKRVDEAEAEELYKLRQKVNSLTLEKSNLRTDMKIAEEIGDQSKVDKCKQRINAINSTIRDIKASMPNETLEKQITAIKR